MFLSLQVHSRSPVVVIMARHQPYVAHPTIVHHVRPEVPSSSGVVLERCADHPTFDASAAKAYMRYGVLNYELLYA